MTRPSAPSRGTEPRPVGVFSDAQIEAMTPEQLGSAISGVLTLADRGLLVLPEFEPLFTDAQLRNMTEGQLGEALRALIAHAQSEREGSTPTKEKR